MQLVQLKSSNRTRLGAAAVLGALCVLIVSILYTAYRAATDAFVAPIILSPDNDLVLAHKQKVIDLEGQRALAQAQLESVEADLAATAAEEQRLTQMQKLQTGDLSALDRQRGLLQSMHEKAKNAAARAQRNFTAGLITQGDYEKVTQDLHQAEIALLENRRSAMKSETTTADADAPLDVLKVKAAKKAKIVEQKVLSDKVAKLQELEAQVHKRPISLAMDKSLNAAFVPYSQLDNVKADDDVLTCVWGLGWCHRVGRVMDVVPGEVNMTDPWGNAGRGQYILLDLSDPKAATAKTLRVR